MKHQKLLVLDPRGSQSIFQRKKRGKSFKREVGSTTQIHTYTVFLNFLNYEQVSVVRKIYETFTLNVIKKKKKENVKIDVFFLKK